jgi:hypothetical protein
MARQLGCQLNEGLQGPTSELEERSWLRLHAHQIHLTHKITPVLLLMWVFTPFWLDALPYILGL